MATFRDLTTVHFKEAILIREQIDELQAKLAVLLGGTAPKAKPDGLVAKRTKFGAGCGRVDAAPAWRFAHVRSPLDTLMDAAPVEKGSDGGGTCQAVGCHESMMDGEVNRNTPMSFGLIGTLALEDEEAVFLRGVVDDEVGPVMIGIWRNESGDRWVQ